MFDDEDSEYSEFNYRRRVADMAAEWHAYCDEHSFAFSDSDAESWLHDTVDGSRAVFMTAGAWSTCYHSRNSDQFAEEGVDLSGRETLSDVMTGAAYYAMKQDVIDYAKGEVDSGEWQSPELTYTVYFSWCCESDEDTEEEDDEEDFDTLEDAREFFKEKAQEARKAWDAAQWDEREMRIYIADDEGEEYDDIDTPPPLE